MRFYILKPTTNEQKLLIAKISIPAGIVITLFGLTIASQGRFAAYVFFIGIVFTLIGCLALMRYVFDIAEKKIRDKIV